MSRIASIRSLALIVPTALVLACSSSPKETLEGLEEVADRGGFIFPVHLTVLSSRPDVVHAATESQLVDEVRILYDHFVTKSGEKLVGFSFLSASLHDEVASLGCDVVKMANDGKHHSAGQWRKAIKDCEHSEVVDPHAINVFVYDAFEDGSYASQEGHGDLNSFHPYIMLDWARLDHKGQSDEEHEMGHAFGLTDICHESATRFTATNIMATDGTYPDGSGGEADCPGATGTREVGFNAAQEEKILENAKLIHDALGLS